MGGGDEYQRDVDSDSGERGYSREWNRGDHTEKEFVGDHGDHYVEETYKDGTTYRTHDDDTGEKRR
jgi:hypothetical protein